MPSDISQILEKLKALESFATNAAESTESLLTSTKLTHQLAEKLAASFNEMANQIDQLRDELKRLGTTTPIPGPQRVTSLASETAPTISSGVVQKATQDIAPERLEDLTSEVRSLLREMSLLNETLRGSLEERDTLREQLRELQTSHESGEIPTEHFDEYIRQANVAFVEVERRIAALQHQIDSLQGMIDRLQEQIEAAKRHTDSEPS
jgi:chromosome segregation ATPase